MNNPITFIFGAILLITLWYTIWLSGTDFIIKISNMTKIIILFVAVCGISIYFIQQEFDTSNSSNRTPDKEYYYEKAEDYFGDAKTAFGIGQNEVACHRGKTAVEYGIGTHDLAFVQPMQDFLHQACISGE